MSLANAKEVQVDVGGQQYSYGVYDDNDAIYYFNARIENPRHVKLDTFSPADMTWLQNSSKTKADDTPSGFGEKLAEDINVKSKERRERITTNFEAMTARKAAVTVQAANKLLRPVTSKRNKVPESVNLAELSPSHQAFVVGPEDELDDDSTLDGTETTSGSIPDKKQDVPRQSSQAASRVSSSASTASSRHDDGWVQLPSSSSPTFVQNQDGQSSSSTVRARHDGLSSFTGKFSQFEESIRDEDEESFVSDLTANTWPEVPPPNDESVFESDHGSVPNSDNAHKQAIYAELQMIVTLLAGLKGSEPQLADVRKALEFAMTETGITGTPLSAPAPAPTVVAPAADIGTAPISGSPVVTEPEDEDDKLSPIDKLEKNIGVLIQVRDKINALLIDPQDKLGLPLSDALSALHSAVDDSIYEADKALKTLKNKKAVQEGRADGQRIFTSPLNPPADEEEDSSTPTSPGTFR
tara:strand:- start:36469 stop:37872 length:1404 start_codon:yes stop_codon:yes gene_type:complete